MENIEIKTAVSATATAQTEDTATDAATETATETVEVETLSTEAQGNYKLKINGEYVKFRNHSICEIISPKLGFGYSTESGKGKFYSLKYRHGGDTYWFYRPVAKKHIFNRYNELELTEAQRIEIKNFFNAYGDEEKSGGFFKASVDFELADKTYRRIETRFDYFNQARDFADAVTEKFSGMDYAVVVDRNDFAEHHRYIWRTRESTGVYDDIPDTAYYAGMPASQIQNQIDELDRAIESNKKFAEQEGGLIWSVLMNAECNLRKTRNFLAFVLHEDETAHAETETPAIVEDETATETAIFPLLFTNEEVIGRKRRGLPFYKKAANKANVDVGDGKIGGKWQGGLVVEMPVTGSHEGIQKFRELVSDHLKPQTDDFREQLATLNAEHQRAKKLADEKLAAILKAQEEYDRAVAYETETERNLIEFGEGNARQLRNELVTPDITDSPEMTLNTQDNRAYYTKLKTFGVYFNGDKFQLTVDKEASLIVRILATYDTPAQVEKVVGELKDAISRGDTEFTFPTFDEPAPEPTPCEMLNTVDILDRVNAVAPDGWEVEYNGKDFTVKYRGNRVTEIDSLALAEILSPDKFFDRFKPLAPYFDDDRSQFVEDLRRELDELEEMREQLADDEERLRIIDELIDDTKGKIAQAEFNEAYLLVEPPPYEGEFPEIWF